MRFEGSDGGEVEAGRYSSPADAIAHALNSATDDEVRGFLARILLAAGMTNERAARILRLGKTAYYKMLKVPLPAELPDATRPTRPDEDEDD